MKTLEQLQAMSELAAKNTGLAAIAENFSPTAAYDRAVTLCYGEEAARSCRFLAIIRRDYGLKAFKQTVALAVNSTMDKFFAEEIVPGIGFLEKMAGGRLMIVEPEDRGLSLIEYLEKSRACTIDLGLALGEYRIWLKWQVKKSSSCYEMESNLIVDGPNGRLSTTDGLGRVLEEQRSTVSYGDKIHPSESELRSRLNQCLMDNLISLQIGYKCSAAVLIIEDLKRRGYKTPTRFWQYCHIQGFSYTQLVRNGQIYELENLAGDLVKKVTAEGIDDRALCFLFLEIFLTMREAAKQQAKFDMSVPLIEKLHSGKFNVGYSIVPGRKADKSYYFLLHLETGIEYWLDLLERKGYGGSVLVAFYNVPSGLEVALTGQCDAFLIQQYGRRDKEDILTMEQDKMRMTQASLGNETKEVPRFKWDPTYSTLDYETCGGFDKFLDENFPLH